MAVESQPDVADYYTNNSSLYMTSLSFLPLPAWTSQKVWGGKPFPKDHRWLD